MAIPAVNTPAERVEQVAHVVIIGGGITGLSAAWYLEKQAAEKGTPIRVTILEQSDRWGGKIRSERIDGFGDEPFVIEAGPDSFLTQKPWALQLAKELGLAPRLLDTNDAQRSVFVLKKGKLLPLPAGVMMIIPTEFWPFVTSPLISWPGKLRMGLDLFIPPKRDGQDETIAGFVARRLGAEAVDRLADPLMSGIYNAESDKQSVLATFPRFRETEATYGSLIRGMAAARKNRATAPKPEHAMFVSLRTGTQELVEALVRQLSADLRLGAGVERIERRDGGYDLSLTGGEVLHADQLIVTTPAYSAAALLGGIAPGAAAKLNTIRYVSTGTLSLAFRRADIRHPLDGFGLVIPRSEKRRINAVTWTSTKFDHRAPDGHVLLRVFFGGSRRPEMMHLADDELMAVVSEELRDIMGIDAEPVLHRTYRWHDSNPQYDTDHLALVDAIEASLPQGIHVAGSPYRGIGIPDCVFQAQRAAGRIFESILAG